MLELQQSETRRFVGGIGPDVSELMIVTDYPNRDDLISGTVLSGKTGGLVAGLLKKYGVRLDEVYRTAAIKTYIPGIETKHKVKREKLIAQEQALQSWEDQLKLEVETIKPNVILALGEIALNFLTKEYKLDNFRGSILPLNPYWRIAHPIKVVPTLHPRDIWTRYDTLAYVPIDYEKAINLRYHDKPYERKELIWLVKHYKELQNYWDRAKTGEFLVFDIETYLRTYLACISFCVDGYEAISVPLMNWDSVEEMTWIWRKVDEILSSNISKVNQNLKFDSHYMRKWGFTVNNHAGDSALLSNILYPELPKNLGFLTSIYTDQPYYKDEGKEYNPNKDAFERLLFYNAKDSLTTWQIYKKQIKDAHEMKVWSFYKEQVWPLYDIYIKIDERGIRLDFEQRNKLLAKYNRLAELHQFNINNVYGKPLNVDSPKQVGEFVYDYLGCSKITHTTKGGKEVYSTDKESLEELYINRVKDEVKKRVLKEIILLRKILTIKEHILKFVHNDDRLRTSYNLAGTKSGRTSGSESNDNLVYIDEKGKLKYVSYGCTLQNIPKRPFEMEEFEGESFGEDIPSMFIPSPGFVFFEADGKAAEAGVVAVLSNDFETLDYMYNRKTTKRNRFGCKDDIHVLTATWTTVKPFEEITQYDRETYGKRPRHAGNYDMGEYRLHQMIHQEIALCKEILARFHTNAWKVRAVFHALIRELICNQGYLVSPHGRRRDFFGRRDSKMFKQGYSQLPQATVSDHTKFTFPLVLAEAGQDGREIYILAEKHDGVLSEFPKDSLEYFSTLWKKHMERPISFRECSIKRDFDLVIPCEIKWSDTNWQNMVEI